MTFIGGRSTTHQQKYAGDSGQFRMFRRFGPFVNPCWQINIQQCNIYQIYIIIYIYISYLKSVHIIQQSSTIDPRFFLRRDSPWIGFHWVTIIPGKLLGSPGALIVNCGEFTRRCFFFHERILWFSCFTIFAYIHIAILVVIVQW